MNPTGDLSDLGISRERDRRRGTARAQRVAGPPAATRLVLAAVVSAMACASVARVQAPSAGPSPMAHREHWLAAMNEWPLDRLKTYFLLCDLESRMHWMGLDDGARCAMAWDALLKRCFSGDVEAMLAWWRFHRLQREPRPAGQ